MHTPKILLPVLFTVLVLDFHSSPLAAFERDPARPVLRAPSAVAPFDPAGAVLPDRLPFAPGGEGACAREPGVFAGAPSPSRFARGRAAGRALERVLCGARGERPLDLFRSLFVSPVFLSAEYATHAALVLDCDDLPVSHPGVFLDVLHALDGKVPLVCMVSTVQARRELVEFLDSRGLTDDSVFIYGVKTRLDSGSSERGSAAWGPAAGGSLDALFEGFCADDPPVSTR